MSSNTCLIKSIIEKTDDNSYLLYTTLGILFIEVGYNSSSTSLLGCNKCILFKETLPVSHEYYCIGSGGSSESIYFYIPCMSLRDSDDDGNPFIKSLSPVNSLFILLKVLRWLRLK